MYIASNGDIYDDEEVIFNSPRLINDFDETDEIEFMEVDELILRWERNLRL